MPMDPHLAAGLRSALRGAAGWGAVGAGLGALGAEPGHRGEGALHGGLGGAVIGGTMHGLHGFGNSQNAAWEADYAAQAAREAEHEAAYQNARRAKRRAERAEWDARWADPGGHHADDPWAESPPKSPPYTDWTKAWNPHNEGHTAPPSSSKPPEIDPTVRAHERQQAEYARQRESGGFWRGSQPLHGVAPWLKGVTTKAEAKSAYRAQVHANHPDKSGGSVAKMQAVNDQWGAAQAHPDFIKLNAFYDAGRDAAFLRFVERK